MTDLILVGIGDIAKSKHEPAIAASEDFTLRAAVSRHHTVEGVENWSDYDDFLVDGPEGALSLTAPPEARLAMTRKAIAAGRDVMMEKPPAPTVSAALDLAQRARKAGTALLGSWHMRHGIAVLEAQRWLSGRRIRRVDVEWSEDVRKTHPGQDWVFEAGGFGIYDNVTNAFSLMTILLPDALCVTSATHEIPENRSQPIRTDLEMEAGDAPVALKADWRHEGERIFRIEIETDRGTLVLPDGGHALQADGKTLVEKGEDREYQALYASFAGVLAERRVDVDVRPLQLAADAFLLAAATRTDAFDF
ncbi:Gfo/Idh/MocA family protein [Tropicimonas sp. IMCC34011]|uniref:Gfo/Idh/MocA family protein n=1 Tax=Tropicimonas sp. IMCC34011 TaxID=2248759 RepID=UPI000E2687DD|nr:Gfo/Idh/MocA family oxidoreductase [Tropicimonas sp. IMCC34011]